jgi:alpha/beta superfamily hydrolase
MLISHVAAGLAQKLNCHALRFDFRGNGHSGGRWRSAGFGEELCDLRTVVDYVRNELGCKVICIAGHSKGSAAVLRYALEQQELNHDDGQNTFVHVPCFVNLSGRFVTPGEFDIRTRFSKEQCNELAKEGKFTMKTFGGKEVVVTQEDVDERSNASSAFVSEIRTSSVLTIHGSADTTVDVENAKKYDECIPRHSLKIIEGGDHNFNGLKFVGEIVASIGEFINTSSAVV